jgi:hypothetical protein
VETNLTRVDREKTGNCFEQCRFAGAVRADQAQNLAFLYRKANVFERPLLAVIFGKRSDPQHDQALVADGRQRRRDVGSIERRASSCIIATALMPMRTLPGPKGGPKMPAHLRTAPEYQLLALAVLSRAARKPLASLRASSLAQK